MHFIANAKSRNGTKSDRFGAVNMIERYRDRTTHTTCACSNVFLAEIRYLMLSDDLQLLHRKVILQSDGNVSINCVSYSRKIVKMNVIRVTMVSLSLR